MAKKMENDKQHTVEIIPGPLLLNVATNKAALVGLKHILNNWFDANDDDGECDCYESTCTECQSIALAKEIDITIADQFNLGSRFSQKLRKKPWKRKINGSYSDEDEE